MSDLAREITPVNIEDELHEQLRRASRVSCRSINGQAAFWIRIGMLCEMNPGVSYQDLVAKGYLTEAVLNYICLLGWSPKGEYAEQEIFSLPELVKIWSPDGISKSPAIFDPLKLRAINACLLYTSPSPRDQRGSRMPSSA